MKNEIRLVIAIPLFITILLATWAPVQAQLSPPVDCQRVTIRPSTVPEGNSFIRVSGSGCSTAYDIPYGAAATVVVWTPFGHSAFGEQGGDKNGLQSGAVFLRNGNFTTYIMLHDANAGEWDVTVQIWQDHQIVNQGSGGTLTVVETST